MQTKQSFSRKANNDFLLNTKLIGFKQIQFFCTSKSKWICELVMMIIIVYFFKFNCKFKLKGFEFGNFNIKIDSKKDKWGKA